MIILFQKNNNHTIMKCRGWARARDGKKKLEDGKGKTLQ